MTKEAIVPDAEKLNRRKVVARIVRDRKDLVVISSLGSPTYDLAAAGDHDRNFYLWGAMGGASLIGLGLALAQPNTPVAVLVGDGEALMGMGAFATIALQKPNNLSIIVLDNGLYGETGAQLSHTASVTDLAAVAAACGIQHTVVIRKANKLDALAERINTVGNSATVAVIKISAADEPRVLPSRDGVWLKVRTQAALSARAK